MTRFGKILVLAQFALSVMAMTWAMMLYINHIDWTQGTKEAPGELQARLDKVAAQWESIRNADPAWREQRAGLLNQEAYRAADRPWYDAQIKHARNDATAASPAREPVYEKGLLVVDMVDAKTPKHVRPRLRTAMDDLNRPLVSLDANMKAENQQLVALADTEMKFHDLIDEDTKLSTLLLPPQGKGLRQRLEDEKVKVKLAEEELAIMRPLLVNTSVEAELILRRRQMLEARIKELSAAVGVASGRDR